MARGGRSAGASLVLGAVLLLAARGARAEPSPAEIAVARRLFTEATELRRQEKWQEAKAKLDEALAIKETPGLRFHLAHCEERLGRLVEAQVDYDRADELIQGGAKAPDVETLLARARIALRERIPTLIVRVPEGTVGARLTIDGEVVSTALVGKAVPLNPGTHRIAVDAPGKESASIDVSLSEGEDRAMDLALRGTPRPLSPPPAKVVGPPAEAKDQRREPPAPGGFGLREGVLIGEGVITLAGAGIGVVFLVKHGDAQDAIVGAQQKIGLDTTACPGAGTPQEQPCADLDTALDNRLAFEGIAVAGFVGAGVGAAALVATWLVWPRTSTSETARFAVFPFPGGAAVRGAF